MSKDRKIIDIAKQVIDDEVEALIGLKDYIDENFEEIINVICECKGRLIFTGIGKSGHISKKISATLSSTGTSSFFMHSTEAFHGDLGMISKNSITLPGQPCKSNNGLDLVFLLFSIIKCRFIPSTLVL